MEVRNLTEIIIGSSYRMTQFGKNVVPPFSRVRIILWHIDCLLGHDLGISKYMTAVSK
jgi:hypothetical protein